MSQVFLSNQNVEYIYSLVRSKVEDQTNYNIDQMPKLKSKMTPLMQKIYNKSNTDDKTILDKTAISTIVPFFRQLVQKKVSRQSNPHSNPHSYGTTNPITSNFSPNASINPNPVSSLGSYNPDLGMTIMKQKEDVGSQMTNLQNERNNLNQTFHPDKPDLPSFGLNLETDNSHVSNDYERMAQERDTEMRQINNTQPLTPQQVENFQNQVQITQNNVPRNLSDTGFQLNPFSIDNNMAQDLGVPVNFEDNNINKMLGNQNPEDIKSAYDKFQLDRQQGDDQYQLYQKQQQEMKQAEDESRDESLMKQIQGQLTSYDEVGSYLERRSRAGVNTNDNHMNSSMATELYQPAVIEQMRDTNRENEMKMIKQVDNQAYFMNQLPADNERFDRYLDGLRQGKDQYGKRKYIETDHYITVDSQDRLWENDAENRYNFVVHFNSSDFTNGAAVSRNFKNIVAIELLKIVIPQDHHPMPFDHRLYVDFLSFPYLSLHVDEIDGVFNGTSNNTSKAFEHVIVDKEYFTETLTSEQISSTDVHTTSGIKHKFSKQYKRGFYALCPIYDEKKIYYHTPKASLNRMTIRLLTSEGRLLNPLNDHLKINAIAFEELADKELKSTNGFPRTTGQQVIKITTVNHFSNRTFRIGDKIKIKNYTVSSSGSNDSRFEAFINREEGHYIINLDEEETGVSANEGWLNNIYISPPGSIDYTTGALDTTTYYTATPTVSDYGDLLNLSLQMHLMFRITVREDESRSVLQPHNV